MSNISTRRITEACDLPKVKPSATHTEHCYDPILKISSSWIQQLHPSCFADPSSSSYTCCCCCRSDMRTASLAGVMVVMKPASMPAGQSMRMKSGQSCERAFSASTSQVRALPPNPRGSLERGLEMQRSSKLDQHLSRMKAWSRQQLPFRTSITV